MDVRKLNQKKLTPIKEKEYESPTSVTLSQAHKDRFGFLKRQNTMSVASYAKNRKAGNELFE